jgi:competence protein ComEA
VQQLGRSQLIAYGALAVALLLVGARFIRSGQPERTATASFASPSSPATQGRPGTLAVADGGGDDVVVHVTGEVAHPGVYRLPAGSRVDDAVRRAGGPTAEGDAQAINLAARLADGQQIAVPAKSGAPAGATAAPAQPDGPISLGSATLEQLDTIEGIGPVTAQDILDFRDEHGGLSAVDQLDQVPGIGPATMEALRARLQP